MAVGLTAPSGNIALDPKPRSKTSLVEGVAFIVSTKVRGFDLHVQGAGVGSGCVARLRHRCICVCITDAYAYAFALRNVQINKWS